MVLLRLENWNARKKPGCQIKTIKVSVHKRGRGLEPNENGEMQVPTTPLRAWYFIKCANTKLY